MFKKYFRVSKQDGKPRTSYIYDSSHKTVPKKSTVEDGSSMLQNSVLTREASVIKVSEQSLKEWNNSNYNTYGEPIISRRTARHTNRSNGGSIFSLSLPEDETPRTDGESELSPRSECSGIHTELIKLSLGDYLTATQSCEVIKVKNLPYNKSQSDRPNAKELTRAPHSQDSRLISRRRSLAEIRRRSFRCENLLPRKPLNLSTDFTDVELELFEHEWGKSKDHNEGSGYICPEECMSWDEKLSTAQCSPTLIKDLHLQSNFENLETKLSSPNPDRLKTPKGVVPETRQLNYLSKNYEEIKKPSLTGADSAILNKLFAALSRITELEGDLDQVKDLETVNKRLHEKTTELEKSIEGMEKGFHEKKVTWENQIEEYERQIQQYESQISQLRKKHNEEIESRDLEIKQNVRKLKRDHLQAMADLRKTLTGWSENIDSKLETQKKENETLKKKLQARKFRQEELEAEIAKLETDCNSEAKEALRLTKELVEAREQIKLLKIAPVRQKSVHKSLEKENRDLRSTHSDLQDMLQKKEETEKETVWEVQCLTLECERLQGVVMDLRRELSVYKSGRVSYTAVILEKQAERKQNIKISRGHCRARSEATNAFHGGKLLIPNARILRTSINEDECTGRSISATNQMVLPECRKTRSCQHFPTNTRNKWMRSRTKSINANIREISEDERSCSRGDLRLRVGNTRNCSISQVNSRPLKEDSLFDSDSETTYTCRRKAGSFTISTLLKDVNLLLPEDGAHSPSSDDSDSEDESDGDSVKESELTRLKKKLVSPDLAFLEVDKSASQQSSEIRDVVFPAQFI